ncbi:MAG: exodeoxyribonuclease VII small subunit [Pseudomonadota bacterium]|nr:exodeoxyribonuclease VII small subunit [Pseudomonadota bacterium]QKK04439.1 MAG: exodeoxyribonuclease VII small subunit [Pseudomonadota bacterium]
MAESATAKQDIGKTSFEDALTELERIVRELESGKGDLETSIEAYEKGMVLKQHCEAKLKEAQAKIEKITVSEDGSVKTSGFDVE